MRLAALERDYEPSRSPDALVRGTPGSSYGAADAERALETWTRLRDAVMASWRGLVEAEAQVGRDGEAADEPDAERGA